jgi:hypothetical protein
VRVKAFLLLIVEEGGEILADSCRSFCRFVCVNMAREVVFRFFPFELSGTSSGWQ